MAKQTAPDDTHDDAEPRLGLRERKKRETRRRIADIATGLFMMRGFDNVTIADVARNADVSVNTVFNYFHTKEDLFFDRQDEILRDAADGFHARRPGESAVAFYRRRFFEGLDEGSFQTGFHEGAEVWVRTVTDSPALMARQREIGQLAQDALAAVLAEETGADPDDVTPRIVAAMIHAAQWSLVGEITKRKLAGETLEEMRDSVHADAARVFDLLEHGIGDYAAKPRLTALPADAPNEADADTTAPSFGDHISQTVADDD
ncbi:TetR/AcrR family transcriptional regulator [Actinomadura rupiterrae]|uniref:TetR/AcrR family transcriptional regulator n=1 Tax=Actinomadura rupiterrae TaxID=559627 RepID=UPI0020A4E915|nr:TetR/AcrR family transcriptional regulator [Actinomadura rupiterrae]MCP2343096.1 AcrR family transcriptional regulator [Actinomadura rupiterrae]